MLKTSTTRILELHSTWIREGKNGMDNQDTLNGMTGIELLDFRTFFRDPPNKYRHLEYSMVENTVGNELVRRVELDIVDNIPEECKLDILLTQRIDFD